MALRILIVDDEPFLLEAFQRQLRGNDYEVETVGSTELAMELINSKPADEEFAVIVCDLHLRGENGVSFFVKLEQAGSKSIRILFTGASDHRHKLSEPERNCIFQFLDKPCSGQKFRESIDYAILAYQTPQPQEANAQSAL